MDFKTIFIFDAIFLAKKFSKNNYYKNKNNSVRDLKDNNFKS